MHRRIALTLLTWLLLAAPMAAQKMVLLVRHAERGTTQGNPDPELTDAGRQRAQLLAQMLRDTGITAIYATEFRRTQHTAHPLAERLGIAVRQVPARASTQLVKTLRSEHAEGIVLVVGHSNTVPELLSALGHDETVRIEDAEYDNLFFVTPRGEGRKPLVFRIRFGASSAP